MPPQHQRGDLTELRSPAGGVHLSYSHILLSGPGRVYFQFPQEESILYVFHCVDVPLCLEYLLPMLDV